MSPRTDLLSKVLEAVLKFSSINKPLSLEEISNYTLISKDQVRRMLNILRLPEEEPRLREEEKIEAVLIGLRFGVDGSAVARYLSWKEFEKLVTRILLEMGYDAEWNLRLSHEKGHVQLDILAYNGNLMLVIDCKRWNRPLAPSAESNIKEGQERRLVFLKELIKEIPWEGRQHVTYLVPLVLSLYQPSKPILGGHVFASIKNLKSAISFVEKSFFQLRNEAIRIPKEFTLKDIVRGLEKRYFCRSDS